MAAVPAVPPALERACVGDCAPWRLPVRRLSLLCSLLHPRVVGAASALDMTQLAARRLTDEVAARIAETRAKLGATGVERVLAAVTRLRQAQRALVQIDTLASAVFPSEPPYASSGGADAQSRVAALFEDWRGAWEAEREQYCRLCMELMEALSIGAEEEEEEAIESLTLLTSALNESVASAALFEAALVRAAIDRVTDYGRMVMLSIPDWFISPSEVQLDEAATGVQVWNRVPVRVHRVLFADPVDAITGEERCIRHVDRWCRIAHPNVLRLYGGCHVGKRPFLVYEHAHDETLLDAVIISTVGEADMWQRLFEAACGLKHIHDEGLVHGKLLADSIRIGQDGKAKIDTSTSTDLLSESGGGLRITERLPTQADDVYAFAMGMIEIVAVSQSDTSVDAISARLQLGEGDADAEQPSFLSTSFWSLLLRMCKPDLGSRVGMDYVVNELQALLDYLRPWSDDMYPELLRETPEVWAKYREMSLQCRADVVVCGRVLDRLEHVLSHLWDDIVDPDSGFWLTRTENLVQSVRFCVLGYLSKPELMRLAQLRRFMEEIQSIHGLLDVLFVEFESYDGSPRASKIPSWKDQWDRDRAHVLDFFEDYLEYKLHTTEEFTRYADCAIDVSTLLRYELDNYSYLLGPRELTLIRRALSMCWSRYDAVVVSTPDWFIPPHAVRDGEWWEGVRVAVHYLPDALSDRHEFCMRQAELWSQLVHPHIVKFYGASHVGQQFLVFERTVRKTLQDHFMTDESDDDVYLLERLHEAALGLQYFHEREIAHSSLRCKDILIVNAKTHNPASPTDSAASNVAREIAKLAGDGLVSLRTKSERDYWRSVRHEAASEDASAFSLADDRLDVGTVSLEADIYAFGLCIAEAWTHQTLARTNRSLDGADCNSKRLPDVLRLLPQNIAELVTKMCDPNPVERVSISYVAHQLQRALTAARRADLDEASDDNTGRDFAPFPLHHYKLATPSSASIPKALRALHQRVADGNDELTRHIYDRLVDICGTLERREELCQLPLLRRLGDVVMHFRAFAHTSRAQRHIAEYFASNRTGGAASKYFVLHQEIDQLLVDFLGDVKPLRSVHSWKPNWFRNRSSDRELQSGSTIELLQGLHGAESGDEEETLALLQYELARHTDANYSVELKTALVTAIRERRESLDASPSLLLSREVTQGIPKWFIPPYEVVFNELESFSHGAFASVHMGMWLNTPVVIKNLVVPGTFDTASAAPQRQANSSALQAVFAREVHIWYRLAHPYVLKLFGACHVGGRQFFVCEHAAHGTVDEYLRLFQDGAEDTDAVDKKDAAGRAGEMWRTLLEAVLGLQYLHQHGIVHGDLKCDNILVAADGSAKLADFGLSSVLSQRAEPDSNAEQHKRAAAIGAPRWKAPECLRGEEPTFASDVYSFGMCILQAASGDYPWGVMPDAAVRFHVKKGKLPPRPASRRGSDDDTWWELVRGMCHYEPAQRTSLAVVIQQLTRLADRESRRQRRSSRVAQLLFH